MEYPTINDLPNELLEMIFDHFDVEDLKDASLVCRRWSDLAFLGRRMDRVTLVPKFPCCKYLLQSNRKYRHLELREIKEGRVYVKKLLQTFSVTSLRIKNTYTYISHSSVRSILLEAPNLQHLSIFHVQSGQYEMIEPLPVMSNLQRLEIDNLGNALPWHTIAPSVQGLKMCCNSEEQLEQWRLFSGQLKHIYVTFHEENLMNRFCQMTFPLLEELSIKSASAYSSYEAFLQEHDLFRRHEFFRRNTSLRHLRLDGIYLSKTLVQGITNHNKKLTSFEIRGGGCARINGEPGSLESLAQLPELKHLRLTLVDVCIFRGCEALTTLQSLCIDKGTTFGRKGSLGFFKDILKIAPQVRCLEVSVVMAPRAVQYICQKFKQLTHLQLKYSEKVTRGGFSEIHRLPFLWYLELKLTAQNLLFISTIPQNKVRCLTLHLPYKYDGDDLLQLPEVFPQLDRLNLINSRLSLRESTVDKLRQLLPLCVIKIYGLLITNAGVRKCFSKWPENEIVLVWEKEWVWKK